VSQAQSSLPVAFVVTVGGAVAVLVHAIGTEGLWLVWLRAHGRVCVCVCVSLRFGEEGLGIMQKQGYRRGVQKMIK